MANSINSTTLVPPQVLAAGTWLTQPQVTLKTSLGNIVIELNPNAAPVTVANHLAYVSSGFYDNLLFHRVIEGFVVQGGGFSSGLSYKTPPYAPIVLESTNGLENDRGTIAMARTSAANSATSQFFINLVDNNSLNATAPGNGYAVFGKVLSGMAVVDAIAVVDTNSQDAPVTEVKILEADQTRLGTVHSTTGRIDIGLLASEVVWTGEPGVLWEFSVDGGATWTLGSGRSFTLQQGAYEVNAIQVRYMDLDRNVGGHNSTGGSVVVDARDVIAGDGSANKLKGGSAAEPLYGLGGNDKLDGAGGADTLTGGTGNDTLTGGGGDDVFRFSSALNGSGNADRITDFGAGGDAIGLENSVFTALTSTGVLASSRFKASTSGNAGDSNDFVLYETDTGKLFYDADGNGAGAKVLIATLSGAPTLSAGDIFVT